MTVLDGSGTVCLPAECFSNQGSCVDRSEAVAAAADFGFGGSDADGSIVVGSTADGAAAPDPSGSGRGEAVPDEDEGGVDHEAGADDVKRAEPMRSDGGDDIDGASE